MFFSISFGSTTLPKLSACIKPDIRNEKVRITHYLRTQFRHRLQT